MTTSPLKQNRSLIDAMEKPLRRSPPGKPHEEEDWPVLFPDRPTTPGTLRQMTPGRNVGLANADKVYQPAERYPRLPSLDYESTIGVERKAAPKIPSNHQTQRKQVASPNLRKTITGPKHTAQTNKENVRPGTTPMTIAVVPESKSGNSTPKSKITDCPALSNNTSVNIIPDEKPVVGSKPSIEPRQTRTSSLRARISAGSVIKGGSDGTDKVHGITDFTAPSESLGTEKDIKRRSTPKPPGAFPIGPKFSRDSLRGKKPAQFVAGSRRPTSRGSLRSESRASSNITQPQPADQSMPDDLMASIPAPAQQSNAASALEDKGPEIAPRKSSIPVFRQAISNLVTKADNKLISEESKSSDATDAAASAHDQFAIFEDNKESHPITSLDAIQESPHQGYHVRRLSVLSPEIGPTLKISPSADRIIMGTGSDKENDEPKKKSKDKRRALAPLDVRSSSTEKESTTTKTKCSTQKRPSSSQGLLQSTTRRGVIDSEIRAKKVRSAEIGSSPSQKRFSHLSTKTPKTSRKDIDTSNNDPFFDAQSSIDKRISRLSAPENRSVPHENAGAPAEAEWVAPVQKHLSLTADSDALLNPCDVQSMMTHEENPTDSVTADILSMLSHEDEAQGRRIEATPALATTANNVPVELPAGNAQPAKKNPTRISEPTPTTPEPLHTATASSRSGSLPPRSSSRTTHPDFIGNKRSPPSPLGNKEHVPKEFTERQNRLGSLRGLTTAQVDFADPVSKRNSTRDSVARESHKSQASISKGMLSNIKGLFHKRSADEPLASSTKNGKKHKQQKVGITSNGSPFPPISEIHPVHRPTLSSARRFNANGLAPKSSLPEFSTHAPPTPSFNSPAPSELATTTTMAMQILESARKERSSPRKERLLELGKILVDAITQARDAEKAFEEAKHAARRAEISYELCKRSVSDVKKVVEQWRYEMARASCR